MSSDVVNNIVVEDDEFLRLKVQIASHGYEDSAEQNHRSGCRIRFSIGIRIVATAAAFQRFQILKVDVDMAFHQSDPADRNVYEIPPK